MTRCYHQKKTRLYSPLLKLLGRDEALLTLGHSWWYIQQRNPSLLSRFCGLICKWTDWIQRLPWSVWEFVAHLHACMSVNSAWDLVYKVVSLSHTEPHRHPTREAFFVTCIRHRVSLPFSTRQGSDFKSSWCLCLPCVCAKKKAEKIWNSDITSWMPESQVSTCLGPWLLAPACCTGLLGQSSAAPRAPQLCRMERCVCVSGERGWISDVVSFPLKILAVLSRLGEESNSKIIWRCWVKVKKKQKTKKNFGWIYQCFYFILLKF